MSDDYQKRIKKRLAEYYSDALKQAEGEADLAFGKLQHFEGLVADAKAYEAWDDIIERLEIQKKALDAEWMRRKKIAELCRSGFKARFGEDAE